MEKLVELIFIPSPGAGHLFSAIEMAKILLDRDERLSVTILLMKLPILETKTDVNSINIPRLQLLDLPQDDAVKELMQNKPQGGLFLIKLIEIHKTHVRNIVSERLSTCQHHKIGGFVIDMFCTPMIEVANEFGLPTYAFFTSGASTLNLTFYIQEQVDEHDQDSTSLYKDSNAVFSIPGFENPVPIGAFPSVMREGGVGHDMIVHIGRNLRRDVKGIIINTLTELEPFAVQALFRGKNPPVYPVGPVLNLQNSNSLKNEEDKYEKIISWLDLQPPCSVVFLCFGSMGSFDEKQVKEIAIALERSEQRFLWALRMRPKTGELKIPADLANPEEVLPEGFLERTKDIGRVIGWAPQMTVLSHPAVGGFVSHCGWNSTLESVWSGVLMGTWPLYAEQQLNAFQLVKELGIAMDIKIDFRTDFHGNSLSFVSADEIEIGIRKMMEMEGQEIEVMRNKVKDMKVKSRQAVMEGGSSYNTIGLLINDIIDNIA
ncbi:hypothetical protein Leryth_023249 [Lithospermum erythrorhizon]|nr:hypothetical protein Leryth_023249 [Lithospermum erythrorhizon]